MSGPAATIAKDGSALSRRLGYHACHRSHPLSFVWLMYSACWILLEALHTVSQESLKPDIETPTEHSRKREERNPQSLVDAALRTSVHAPVEKESSRSELNATNGSGSYPPSGSPGKSHTEPGPPGWGMGKAFCQTVPNLDVLFNLAHVCINFFLFCFITCHHKSRHDVSLAGSTES